MERRGGAAGGGGGKHVPNVENGRKEEEDCQRCVGEREREKTRLEFSGRDFRNSGACTV